MTFVCYLEKEGSTTGNVIFKYATPSLINAMEKIKNDFSPLFSNSLVLLMNADEIKKRAKNIFDILGEISKGGKEKINNLSVLDMGRIKKKVGKELQRIEKLGGGFFLEYFVRVNTKKNLEDLVKNPIAYGKIIEGLNNLWEKVDLEKAIEAWREQDYLRIPKFLGLDNYVLDLGEEGTIVYRDLTDEDIVKIVENNVMKYKEEIGTAYRREYGLLKTEKNAIKNFFSSMTNFIKGLYPFILYTLSPISGLLLGFIGWAGYKVVDRSIPQYLRKGLKRFRKGIRVMDDVVYDVASMILQEVRYGARGGFSILDKIYLNSGKIFEYILEKANLTPKERQRVLQYFFGTKGGLHTIPDIALDAEMRDAALYWVLKDIYGIPDVKLVEIFDGNISVRNDNNIVIVTTKTGETYRFNKRELEKYTEEMVQKIKGFYYGRMKNIKIGSLGRAFDTYFNFFGRWGFFMMRNMLTSIPAFFVDLGRYLYYNKIGDERKMQEILEDLVVHKMFVDMFMGSMIQSIFWGNQLHKAREDEAEKDADLSYIRKLIKLSFDFNMWMQSIESNAYGRTFLGFLEGMEDGGIQEGVYSLGSEMVRNFAREFKIINPIAQAIGTYLSTRDKNLAIEAFWDSFNRLRSGYVRFFVDGEGFNFSGDTINPLDVIRMIEGDVSKQKEIYMKLRREENMKVLENIFEGRYKTEKFLSWLGYNIPVLKAFLYGLSEESTIEKINKITESMKDDPIWFKIRYEGKLPSLDELPPDIKDEFVMYVTDLSTRFLRYGTEFSENEIKEILKSFDDKLLENNIIAKQIKDYLGSGYGDIIKLWKNFDKEQKKLFDVYVMLETRVPGSGRKLLSWLANQYKEKYMLDKYGTFSRSKLSKEQQLDVDYEIAKKTLPFFSFNVNGQDGVIDMNVYTSLAMKYLSLVNPELKDILNNKQIRNKIKRMMMLDLYVAKEANEGNVDVLKMKNMFTKIGSRLWDNDEERALIVSRTLEMISKMVNNPLTRLNLLTGVLIANFDLIDNLEKKFDNLPFEVKLAFEKIVRKLFTTNSEIERQAKVQLSLQDIYKNLKDRGLQNKIAKDLGKYLYDLKKLGRKNISFNPWNALRSYYKRNYGTNISGYRRLNNYVRNRYKSLSPYNNRYVRRYATRIYPSRVSTIPVERQYSRPYTPRTYTRLQQALTQRLIYELTKQAVNRYFQIQKTRVSRATIPGLTGWGGYPKIPGISSFNAKRGK